VFQYLCYLPFLQQLKNVCFSSPLLIREGCHLPASLGKRQQLRLHCRREIVEMTWGCFLSVSGHYPPGLRLRRLSPSIQSKYVYLPVIGLASLKNRASLFPTVQLSCWRSRMLSLTNSPGTRHTVTFLHEQMLRHRHQSHFPVFLHAK